MSINLREIGKSWIISLNPNKEQKELADLRHEICVKCEFKKEIFEKKEWSSLCGKCGCPLSKKIYSDEYGACPEKKWLAVESLFENILRKKLKSKENNTLL